MRARLTIAPQALGFGPLPLPAANLVHRTLLENIWIHARLVFSGDDHVKELIQTVKSDPTLPPDARKLWIETLIDLRQQGRITVRPADDATPLADVRTLEELRSAWGPYVDIAVIPDSSCAALGVPAEGVRSDPGLAPEIATCAAVTETTALRHVRALVQNPRALQASSREVFWHEVLEPLAIGARFAVVLDHYLFDPAWALARREHWTRGWHGEHVAWLLRHLDSVMAPGAEVRLIGERPARYAAANADETAQIVYDLWQPPSEGRLGVVEVVVTERDYVSRFPHDRHIRFNSGGAVTISAGFDRLRAESLWDANGMAWSYAWHPEALQALGSAEGRAVTHAASSQSVVIRRESAGRHGASAA